MIEVNKIYNADCLELLKEFDENSIDVCITDPPYELNFMNKGWDNSGIAFQTAIWLEVLRVLKPGGHLLAFGGSRTYHRIACAIEDAGFEIRDMIEWVYGSGFPKSLDISKAIDKNTNKDGIFIWDKLIEWQKNLNKKRLEKGLNLKDIKILFNTPMNSGQVAHKFTDTSQPQFLTRRQFDLLKPVLDLGEFEERLFERIEREIIGIKKSGLTKGTIANFQGDVEFDLTKASSEQAKLWDGYGTALKPAHEPICIARKPISEKNIALNVLKWGTGGINIDGCRVEIDKEIIRKRKAGSEFGQESGWNNHNNIDTIYDNTKGRFPANLIHDGSEEVMKEFDKAGISMNARPNCDGKTYIRDIDTNNFMDSFHKKALRTPSPADIGTPARFFKQCKYEDGELSRFYYTAKIWEILQIKIGKKLKTTIQL